MSDWNLHLAAYDVKRRIVLRYVDKMVDDIEGDIDDCILEMSEVMSSDDRFQILRIYGNVLFDRLRFADEAGSDIQRIEGIEDRIDRCIRLRSVEREDECDLLFWLYRRFLEDRATRTSDSARADRIRRIIAKLPVPRPHPISIRDDIPTAIEDFNTFVRSGKPVRRKLVHKSDQYTYWCCNNDVIINLMDPVSRYIEEDSCRDMMIFHPSGVRWIDALAVDIMNTFSHARELLFRYEKHIYTDFVSSDRECDGFRNRFFGEHEPDSEARIHRGMHDHDKGSMRWKYHNRDQSDWGSSLNDIRFVFEEEVEYIVDALFRLYSILDKIANMVVRVFKITISNDDGYSVRPSIAALARYIDREGQPNPYLRTFVNLYVEVKPESLGQDSEIRYTYSPDDGDEAVSFTSLPSVQSLYNIRNHIAHSEFLITYSEENRGDINPRSGIIGRLDLFMRAKELLYIAKEAIFTAALAIEYERKDLDETVRSGRL